TPATRSAWRIQPAGTVRPGRQAQALVPQVRRAHLLASASSDSDRADRLRHRPADRWSPRAQQHPDPEHAHQHDAEHDHHHPDASRTHDYYNDGPTPQQRRPTAAAATAPNAAATAGAHAPTTSAAPAAASVGHHHSGSAAPDYAAAHPLTTQIP